MRGTEAGKRLIYLSIPFLAFGLLLAFSPPARGVLGPDGLQAVRTLGWVLTGVTVAAIGFGVYLYRQGEDRIV